jgi:23S rRNA (guanosine2251-2'-O)-methyltransferase
MDKGRRDLIPGYHAVREALLKGFPRAESLWIVPGKRSRRVEEVLLLARRRGIPIVEVRAPDLERLAPGVAHQGVALSVGGFVYTPLEDVIDRSAAEFESRWILALDHITDEGNFGAILRTAAFFGVDAVVIPKDRSVRVTPAVLKRASGAHSSVAVSRVVNLNRALSLLKEAGFWILGAAGESERSVYDFDWRVPVAVVVGNEQKGLGDAVRKRCDGLVSIPGSGAVESLNVSVATGVLLAEIARQRQAAREAEGKG